MSVASVCVSVCLPDLLSCRPGVGAVLKPAITETNIEIIFQTGPCSDSAMQNGQLGDFLSV